MKLKKNIIDIIELKKLIKEGIYKVIIYRGDIYLKHIESGEAVRLDSVKDAEERGDIYG